MAKKETRVSEEVNVSIPAVKVTEFTRKAFSIVYEGDRNYRVVSINYNPTENLASSSVEVVASGLDLYDAQEEFKKQVVMAGLFDNGLDN